LYAKNQKLSIRREYFSSSAVHQDSWTVRQLLNVNWSLAHERREAFFWIDTRSGFTCSIFNERRRSSSLVNAFVADGMFIGQPDEFFELSLNLAVAADSVVRGF